VGLYLNTARGGVDTLLLVLGVVSALFVGWVAFICQAYSKELQLMFCFPRPFSQVRDFLNGIGRREQALSLQLQASLFADINSILNASLEILPVTSAELTLVDRETNVYHASFVAGSPFRSDSSASLREGRPIEAPLMISNLKEFQEQDKLVIMIPISVARKNLGLLRFRFRPNLRPKDSDWAVIGILALQCMRALVEDNFTEKVLRIREGAESSVKTKTGFLAQLSHELRGPLGIMLNAVQLVLEEVCGDITQDQRETLQIAHGNGKHLLELVNDVLDFARAESGRMPVEREVIDAVEFLTDIVNVTSKVADSKNHTLKYIPPVKGQAFLCDRRHGRQILINILTNAIKYTPAGGIIEVWTEATAGKLRINVRDTGVGISEQDRENVFTPFARIEHGYAKEQAGTGIGMSLTRELTELNQGSIDFSSVPGEGTHFWVNFESGVLEKDQKSESEEQEIDGNNIQVLVLLSAEQEQQMVTRYLEHHNFGVNLVSNSEEIANVLSSKVIGVVVLDFLFVRDNVVQKIEGITNAMRDRYPFGLPIVGIIGNAFHSDIEDAIRSGMSFCITKPIDLHKLGAACVECFDSVEDAKEKHSQP
jgi:signal transduction histidine kinase/CheY-like chemotaxis protein